MKTPSVLTFLCGMAVGGSAFLSISSPAIAQNARGGESSMVKISAQVVEGEWLSPRLRLTGTAAKPARVSHPQLDVTAPKIEVNSDDKRQLSRVTATGGVRFAITLPQKSGPATRIEAKADNAILERPTSGPNAGARVLTLRGGVDGWYQLEGGQRNALRGQNVTLTSRSGANEALLANIEGGAEGVRLEVPPAGGGAPNNAANRAPVVIIAQNAVVRQQNDNLSADVEGGTRGVRMEIPSIGASGPAGELLQGAVVVTSSRAVVRQSEGVARFIGNAHVVSSGARKFDVTANEILLSRNAKGDFDLVKTTGRAKMKLDLPQEQPAKAPAADDKDKGVSARPTYLEVEADSAEAQLAKNQLVLAGNVRGFYRVPAQAKPNQAAPVTTSTDHPFSGQRLVISYDPNAANPAQALNINFSSPLDQPPVEILAPDFSLDDF
jgi:lipopolysaccharide export system protein LptA